MISQNTQFGKSSAPWWNYCGTFQIVIKRRRKEASSWLKPTLYSVSSDQTPWESAIVSPHVGWRLGSDIASRFSAGKNNSA